MTADGLVMLGARASAIMLLTLYSHNIPFLTTEELIHKNAK